MIKKLIDKAGEWFEDRVRRLVGPLSPDRRLILILSMLFVFGVGSIYMTVSSIYNFGKDEGERLKIEQIEFLKLELESHQRDSINNQLNFNEYGQRESK